tara:strand:+ start:113 stop:526 length:414 start_codon:yes stop_codon:yes gene_type:complete
MHLIIDGFGGNLHKMENPNAIYQFLDEYPDAIGMTKITSPHVYTYEGQEPKDKGISGFVLIAESHISVHTFPEHSYMNVDVFSCKDFDVQRALEEISTIFSLETVKSWTLARGLEYANPEMAARVTQSERSQLATRF